MALGTVKASGGLQTSLINDQSSAYVAQATSGLGDAVNRLAQAGLTYLNSRTEIEKIYDKRAMASKSLELDTQFLQYQQERAKEFAEFSRERSASPGGMTQEYDAMLAEKEKAFLATVPERHREEMAARLAQDRAVRVGSAFTAELELLDTADTNNLNKGLTTLGSALKGGSMTLEDAQGEWEDLVNNSGLPAATKQSFIDSGRATLQGLEFGTIVERTALGYGSVTPSEEGDVVAAGLLPAERAVLNAISSRESPGYDVWNGGQKFSSYADHPAALGNAPGESTAAGKYQFVLSTWRAATDSYEKTYGVKVPDFSPEWQDRVALHWMEVIFNKYNKEGLTFKQVLASGDPAQIVKIRRVLGNPKFADNPSSVEWEGWSDRSFGPGGAEAADRAFLEIFTGKKGIAGGGTGAAEGPNVWTDPRFSNLSIEQKLSFANAAAAAVESQRSAAATQLKLEREKFLDEVYNAGYQNQPGVLEALQQSKFWDAEAQAKYNAGQDVYRKSESGMSSVVQALNSGTPLTPKQGADFARWFGADGFNGIIQGDEQAFAKLRYGVSNAKMFPEGSPDAFRQAMANPNVAPIALDFLASVHAGDPTILSRSGFSKDDIAAVNLFKRIAERSPNMQVAYENYTKASSAESRTGRTESQLASEASKIFMETYPDAKEVVNQVFDTWFTFEPKLPSAAENQFLLEAATAFQDGYKIYGTTEGAETYMQTVLTDTWGVTQTRVFRDGNVQFSNSVLVKHPPEKYYKSFDEDYGPLYKAISEHAVAGGAQASNAILLADDITDREVREGKAPTYKVIGMDEFGAAIVLPDRFGGEELYQQTEEKYIYNAMRANAMHGINVFSQAVESATAKLQSLSLSGGTPEEIAAAQDELARAMKGKQVAVETALANEHLDAAMPTSPDDPAFKKLVEVATDAFANDASLQRQSAALASSYKNVDWAEANRRALADIFGKQYKLTPEMAMALTNKVLENY